MSRPGDAEAQSEPNRSLKTFPSADTPDILMVPYMDAAKGPRWKICKQVLNLHFSKPKILHARGP